MDLRFVNDTETNQFDLNIVNWDLEMDDGLETAILISLFSDTRVESEELSAGDSELRGFWGDAVDNPDQINTGSKLWLLERSKITDETLESARQYCIDALQWLLDDGVAGSLEVEVTRLDNFSIGIEIQISRPTGENLNFKYDYVWEARSRGV